MKKKVRSHGPSKSKKPMVPFVQVVWAEDLTKKEFKEFKKQVKLALRYPNYSIISNYEIHWDTYAVIPGAKARLVWGDNISDKEAEDLKQQVNYALYDPNHVIVTDYQVHWKEIA